MANLTLLRSFQHLMNYENGHFGPYELIEHMQPSAQESVPKGCRWARKRALGVLTCTYRTMVTCWTAYPPIYYILAIIFTAFEIASLHLIG